MTARPADLTLPDVLEGEARVRAIVDAIPDWIALLDTGGRCRYVNAAFARAWGCPGERASDRHIRDVVGAAVYPLISGSLDRAFAGETVSLLAPARFAFDMAHGHLTLTPLNGADGRVGGVVFLISDVSALVVAEEELRRAAERLRLALEVAQIGICEHDLPSGVIIVEGAMEHGSLVGPRFDGRLETLLEHVHPEDRAEVQHAWSTPGEPSAIDFRATDHSGRVRWLTARIQTLLDERQEPTRILGVHYDTTHHKQIEARLSESVAQRNSELAALNRELEAQIACHERTLSILAASERRLALAVEISGAGVSELRVGAGERLYLSDRWLEILGYTSDEAPEPENYRTWLRQHVHSEDLAGFEVSMEDLMTGAADRQLVEMRMRHRDGTWRWVRTLSRIIERGHDGRSEQIVGVTLDITAEKEREQLLRQRAEQLRRATTALTVAEHRERRRLAELIHDHLQQLLVAAKMQMEIAKGASVEKKPSLISGAVQLIDETMEIARTLTVELRPPVLYEAGLPAALHWLADWMGTHHGLKVELEIDERADPPRDATRALVFQAVRELLFNVVKHAGVDRARVVTRLDDAEELHVLVEDQGKGFDATANRDHAGCFGLFAVKERISALGGKVELRPNAPHGARIELLLPVRAEPSEQELQILGPERPRYASTPGMRSSDPGHPIRVLVVDDHQIVREGIIRVLAEESAIEVVGESVDGEEAISMADRLRPDVILMDVNLPRMNGIQATRIISRRLPSARVIALSIHDDSATMRSMKQAGAVELLNKATDVQRIVETVIRCAAGGASVSSRAAG